MVRLCVPIVLLWAIATTHAVKTRGAKKRARRRPSRAQRRTTSSARQGASPTRASVRGDVAGRHCSGHTGRKFRGYNASDLFASLDELAKRKRRPWALFCGCGPSMNLIDESNAKYIHRYFDVWASNQFFIHKYVTPQFMHVEFKPSAVVLWSRYFDAHKQHQYANTTVIVPTVIDGAQGLRLLETRLAPDNLFAYRAHDLQLQAIGGCVEADGRHVPNMCGPLIAKCSASTTIIMQLIAMLRYDAVWFLGVDLVMHDHFWNQNRMYPSELFHFKPTVTPLARRYKKVHVRAANISAAAHATATRGVHLYISSFVAHNGMRSINMSPYSADLFPVAHGSISALVYCSALGLNDQQLEECTMKTATVSGAVAPLK